MSISFLEKTVNNFVDISIHRRRIRALVDTGSCHNCLNAKLAKVMKIKYSPISNDIPASLTSASGDDLPVYGMTTINVSIGGYATVGIFTTHCIHFF